MVSLAVEEATHELGPIAPLSDMAVAVTLLEHFDVCPMPHRD